MIGIIKMHLWRYLLFPPLFLVWLTYYMMTTRDSLTLPVAIINSIFIYFMSVMPVVIIEAREEAHNGYAFLGTLPVTVRDIVTAKFALVLVCVAALVVYSFVLFAFFDSTPEMLASCRGIILMHAILSLVLTGIVFLVIFRFGARVFLVAAGVVLLLFNVLGLLLFRRASSGHGLIPGFYVSLEQANWAVIVPLGLAVYYGLMRLAVRVKEARR